MAALPDVGGLSIDPNARYELSGPFMGHGVIINMVAQEFPASRIDSQAMARTLEQIGFKIQHHENCTTLELRRIRAWLSAPDNHRNSNAVFVVLICHSNESGSILDVDRRKAFDLDDLVESIDDVQTLKGKPKVVISQACRGREKQVSTPQQVLAEAVFTAFHLDLPHLSDTFVGFSTTPRHVSHAGDTQGSIYLQSLAAYLDKYKHELPFDRIYLMVRQHMAQTKQGIGHFIQGADESNRLLKLLYFAKEPNQQIQSMCVHSKPQKLILTRKSSFDTGLVVWTYTKSCVLMNGDIVLYGRKTAESYPIINIYRGSKLRCAIEAPFMHEKITLQPVLIQDNHYIAITCCGPKGDHEISLLDPQTKKVTLAYKSLDLLTGKMCVGEPGTLYVVHIVEGDRKVVKLDIRDKQFKDTGHRFNSGMEWMYGMYYTSSHAEKILLFSWWGTNTIQAVNAESGTVLWKVQGEVAGKLCDPRGITTTQQGHVIIADGNNCRLLVLDAGSGELINTHELTECGRAAYPHFINSDKELILQYNYQEKEHITNLHGRKQSSPLYDTISMTIDIEN